MPRARARGAGGDQGRREIGVPRRNRRKTADRRDVEVRRVRTLDNMPRHGSQPFQRRIERAVTPRTCCETSACGTGASGMDVDRSSRRRGDQEAKICREVQLSLGVSDGGIKTKSAPGWLGRPGTDLNQQCIYRLVDTGLSIQKSTCAPNFTSRPPSRTMTASRYALSSGTAVPGAMTSPHVVVGLAGRAFSML